jgi:hypothetical protein
MAAPADYQNKFPKTPPKRLAVVDQNGCLAIIEYDRCRGRQRLDSGAARSMTRR